MKPVVQISLYLTNIGSIGTAAMAISAGVDWLQVGTVASCRRTMWCEVINRGLSKRAHRCRFKTMDVV